MGTTHAIVFTFKNSKMCLFHVMTSSAHRNYENLQATSIIPRRNNLRQSGFVVVDNKDEMLWATMEKEEMKMMMGD
jgi:hypothetical protein